MPQDLRNGRIHERIRLRETEYSDPQTNDVWQQKELPTADIDLAKYLRTQRVQVVFPTQAPPAWKLLQNQLLESTPKGKDRVLIPKEALTRTFSDLIPDLGEPDSDSPPLISAVFKSSALPGTKPPTGLLLVIELGEAEYESHFCQAVVFVHVEP